AHHLPDIASRMASERVNSVILKKQVTHFIEKEQLFVALQQIFQQFSEEQRFVKIYQQGLLDFVDEWQDFLFELHRLFSKTQKRIDHQELLLTKERIDYLSAAGEKHSQTLQLLLQELLTIQSKLQQTIMSQLETFSLADRIVFVRLFQFFDEIERIHHCFTIYLDDWRPRWVKEYLPQNED
ncbi:DNA polymerase III subunit epsilon, partial [Salmonella enterica]|nr:DNA polymerase III subunit epsilon [Salmonella enterica]